MQPPETVDVAIIRSGITGASTTFNLSERAPDLKVATFDARGLCTGATGRNGGLIGRPESYDIRALATELGAEEAVRLHQLTRINREMMVAAIEDMGCSKSVDLNLTGTMVVFHSQEEREAFISDLDFSREHGLKTEGYLVDCEEVAKVSTVPHLMASHCANGLTHRGSICLLPRPSLELLAWTTAAPFTPGSSLQPC